MIIVFFDSTIEQHCLYPTQTYRVGNWKLLHIGGNDSCGPEYPAPPPTPPPPVYDPSQDFCFSDNDTAGNYCWYPMDNLLCGNWKGEGGHGDNDCGRKCTKVLVHIQEKRVVRIHCHDDLAVSVYDPSKDFCFSNNDTAGKYCWYPTDFFPYGNWKGEGDRGYNECGDKCTKVQDGK